MANSISSHFAITALSDGTTIQGSLRVSGTLAQNYNSNTGSCVPDWEANASLRPVVFAVIRKGATYLADSSINNQVWLYNDVEIEFDDSGYSTNFTNDSDSPMFLKGTTGMSLGGSTYSVPCLTILTNLASATNTDLDTIGFQGSVEISGKQASFAAQVDVKIAQMTAQGYLGLISPESAVISTQSDVVELSASLWTEDEQVTDFYCKWSSGDGTDLSTNKSISVSGTDVTDNLIVRCDFYTDSSYSNRVAVAFASIDDTQDPEYLYISMSSSNNSDFSGQLSSGESCDIYMWVATMENSSAINSSYTNFTVQFFDGDQNEITEAVPDVSATDTAGKYYLTVSYDFVTQHGNKITGIVTAS